MSKHPGLEAYRDALQAERAKIAAVIDPLRDERDKLTQSIEPTVRKIRELEKQMKEAQGKGKGEHSRLFEIDCELGALAKALGGKSLSHSGG